MNRDSRSFRALPIQAQIWVVTVIAGGAAMLAVSAAGAHAGQPVLFLVLTAMAIAMSSLKVDLRIGSSQSNLSLAHAVTFWGLLALGPAETMCVAAAGAWAQCTVRVARRNPVHRTLFSMASLVLTVGLAMMPLNWGLAVDPWQPWTLVRATALVAPLYFLLNTAIVGLAVALSTRDPFFQIWARNFLWSAPSYLAGAAFACIAVAVSVRGWSMWIVLLLVPLYLVFGSYHGFVARLREEQNVQLATIEALARAMEANAGCSPDHIRAVQHYAGMLARAAGLSEAEVQAVRTAALLHDIGNLGVPEHILSKSGPLSPEEFERVKVHPKVGADIIRDVPFRVPVAELVLTHHERWDGLGYPAGLSGDAIPLGARILAIADFYSTLLTQRPYRPARSPEDAAAMLQVNAGTLFDPTLIDLFLAQPDASGPVCVEPHAVRGGASRQERDSSALAQIVGAHREEQVLYAIAQSLGARIDIADAMTLIADKICQIVPFVTCALFLGDESEGYECRYAHGPGAEALLRWTPSSNSEIALRLPSCADGRDANNELAAALPCPLIVNERPVGILVLYHTAPAFFTDDHRRVLGRVSEQAATVILNSARFEQTRHESQTDPLTGLPNRRSLAEQFEAGLARARRTGHSIVVIVLDLDRLKEINDTYGHEAGDRALRTVASALRSGVRPYDLCARFGGDEFVVVLWDCEPGQERARMRDVQQSVAARVFEPSPGTQSALSISAGIARYRDDGDMLEELLTVADARMYQDKATRRSRRVQRATDVAAGEAV